MEHVFWLREGVIAGRTGPNRDMWDPTELASGGIGSILSVNNGELVHPRELAAAGINHMCVPFSGIEPPQPGDLEICIAALPVALQFAQSSIRKGQAVLVHCNSGKDRTGMLLSYYLCVTEGLSPVRAIAEVKRVRPIALSAEGWEDLALEALDAVGA
ncbi:MAG: dual specificity protein phosphatase family protein [Lentisphaeria bacterium]|nr:dual specificity protein phosphatase family protein [Lentisphaeria bacterium]